MTARQVSVLPPWRRRANSKDLLASLSYSAADVLLPGGGDGYELAEAARRLGVPTLLVSGHPEAIVEAEARGHPFFAKPFQLSELQRVIRTLIESGP